MKITHTLYILFSAIVVLSCTKTELDPATYPEGPSRTLITLVNAEKERNDDVIKAYLYGISYPGGNSGEDLFVGIKKLLNFGDFSYTPSSYIAIASAPEKFLPMGGEELSNFFLQPNSLFSSDPTLVDMAKSNPQVSFLIFKDRITTMVFVNHESKWKLLYSKFAAQYTQELPPDVYTAPVEGEATTIQ